MRRSIGLMILLLMILPAAAQAMNYPITKWIIADYRHNFNKKLQWKVANQYAGSILKWSNEYGADPDWFAGLYTIESHWNTNATDGLDSWGVPQMQVSTAQIVANGIGLNITVTAQLLMDDPDLAIRLSVKHYADLLKEFNGNPIDATRAYNRGDARVRDRKLPGLDYFNNVFQKYWEFEKFKAN